MSVLSRRRALALAAPGLLAAALLSACATPKPFLFSLDPVPGPMVGAPHRVILVRAVSLARYLDRSPIVHSSAGYRLDIYGNDWWGELPGPMITRVLAANLASRLPMSTVLPETVAMTVRPDLSVEVSVQRFDEDASGALVLAAAYALPGPRETPPPETFHTIVRPPAPNVTGQVAAMSEALGQLADAIALKVAATPAARR
ncbi:MAG: PqiC family protein [Acetobacteraceae bacterium]